jgi:hypothetical protein
MNGVKSFLLSYGSRASSWSARRNHQDPLGNGQSFRWSNFHADRGFRKDVAQLAGRFGAGLVDHRRGAG